MNYQMDWSVLWEERFLRLFAQGLLGTLLLTAVSSLLSLTLGSAVAYLRGCNSRLGRGLALVYIEVFRGVPALMQIMFWGFAFPLLFPLELRIQFLYRNPLLAWVSSWSGLPINFEFMAATLGLSLNTSAYIAEILRAGVNAIPPGEIQAARASGLGTLQIYRYLLFPQALRRMFSPLSTRLLHNMKNTALASVISTEELFRQARVAISYTFRGPEFLVEVTVIYLLLSWSVVLMIRLTERTLKRRGLILSFQER